MGITEKLPRPQNNVHRRTQRVKTRLSYGTLQRKYSKHTFVSSNRKLDRFERNSVHIIFIGSSLHNFKMDEIGPQPRPLTIEHTILKNITNLYFNLRPFKPLSSFATRGSKMKSRNRSFYMVTISARVLIIFRGPLFVKINSRRD